MIFRIKTFYFKDQLELQTSEYPHSFFQDIHSFGLSTLMIHFSCSNGLMTMFSGCHGFSHKSVRIKTSRLFSDSLSIRAMVSDISLKLCANNTPNRVYLPKEEGARAMFGWFLNFSWTFSLSARPVITPISAMLSQPKLRGLMYMCSPVMTPVFFKRLYRLVTAVTDMSHILANSVKLVRDSIRRVFRILASVSSIFFVFTSRLWL